MAKGLDVEGQDVLGPKAVLDELFAQKRAAVEGLLAVGNQEIGKYLAVSVGRGLGCHVCHESPAALSMLALAAPRGPGRSSMTQGPFRRTKDNNIRTGTLLQNRNHREPHFPRSFETF